MKTVIADNTTLANRWLHCLFVLGFVPVMLAIQPMVSTAQISSDADIEIDMILTPELQKAQVLSLTSLGISGNRGSGQKLFDLIIRNNRNRSENELYLNVKFSSKKRGLLVEFFQVQRMPFSLDPMQVVVTDNVQMQNNIPGIEEQIILEGGFTGEGEDFFNNLGGSTRLPADTYTVEVAIYDRRNSRNGGVRVAEVTRSVGSSIVEEIGDLYLVQPGDALGSDAVINTTLPVFRWDGPFNIRYRLIVVEEDGQNSPEALLQSAESSSPSLDAGSVSGGSLLEFEMVDALVNNITFGMPPNGVQNLKAGKRYYWQVTAIQESIDGTNTVSSEIWSFRVADTGSAANGQVSSELFEILKSFLSEEEIRQLERGGFKLISITVDGQTLQGVAALQKLVEMEDQLNEGDITLIEQ